MTARVADTHSLAPPHAHTLAPPHPLACRSTSSTKTTVLATRRTAPTCGEAAESFPSSREKRGARWTRKHCSSRRVRSPTAKMLNSSRTSFVSPKRCVWTSHRVRAPRVAACHAALTPRVCAPLPCLLDFLELLPRLLVSLVSSLVSLVSLPFVSFPHPFVSSSPSCPSSPFLDLRDALRLIRPFVSVCAPVQMESVFRMSEEHEDFVGRDRELCWLTDVVVHVPLWQCVQA